VRIPKIPNSISSPRDTSFAGAADTSTAPLLLFANSPSAPGPVEIGGEYVRDEDDRDPVRDFVSPFAESLVDPTRDPDDEDAAGGFSSLVFAVDDVLGASLGKFADSALSRRSIMLRALPPNSIAFLICGPTIFAAVLPALLPAPLLILSAIGSFNTIVGIEDAAGLDDTADFHADGVGVARDAAGAF